MKIHPIQETPPIDKDILLFWRNYHLVSTGRYLGHAGFVVAQWDIANQKPGTYWCTVKPDAWAKFPKFPDWLIHG